MVSTFIQSVSACLQGSRGIVCCDAQTRQWHFVGHGLLLPKSQLSVNIKLSKSKVKEKASNKLSCLFQLLKASMTQWMSPQYLLAWESDQSAELMVFVLLQMGLAPPLFQTDFPFKFIPAHIRANHNHLSNTGWVWYNDWQRSDTSPDLKSLMANI